MNFIIFAKTIYMKIHTFIAFLFILSLSCFNATIGYCLDDSLVYIRDLTFPSSIEKTFFNKSDSASNHDLFTAFSLANINYDTSKIETNYNKYKSLLTSFEDEKFNKLKDYKRVTTIYDKAHATFFNKYELYTVFESIFDKGIYNCVTGTSLYSLILQHFNISYSIKETPEHVYLIAYPENRSIKLESTDPKSGYTFYTQQSKEKFVEYLKSEKIISINDISTIGIDSLFEKYYFANNSVTPKQLVAIQYSNNAIYQLNDNKNELALNQILKSYYLYQSTKTKYLLYNTLLQLISKTNYKTEADWGYYILMSRFSNTLISSENLRDEFSRLTNKLLIEQTDTILYKKAYEKIISNISDSTLKKNIMFVYGFEMGRMYLVFENPSQAFPFLEQANKCQPNNYQAERFMVDAYLSSLKNIKNDKDLLFPIEHFLQRHNSIHDNKKLISILLNIYSNLSNNALIKGSIKEGEQYLDKFEQTKSKFPDITFDGITVESLYTSWAAKYFSKNKAKAQGIIKRGLKLDPKSKRLQDSLKMF